MVQIIFLAKFLTIETGNVFYQLDRMYCISSLKLFDGKWQLIVYTNSNWCVILEFARIILPFKNSLLIILDLAFIFLICSETRCIKEPRFIVLDDNF